MNANELANKLLGSLTMEYDCDKYMEQAATMLRQQQALIEQLEKTQDYLYKTHDKDKAEIDFLKKEILAKHEDWKHEGQQAANARAEIEALKAQLSKYNKPYPKYGVIEC